MTDKYAVIGNPIAHSKSPEIHTMFAEQFKGKPEGDMVYKDRILAPLDGFVATVERLRNGEFQGFNVTVPFKQMAYELATIQKLSASTARAANTLYLDPILGDLTADNTDGIGLLRDIRNNLAFNINGKRILLLGAGGAARGVLYPLIDQSTFMTQQSPSHIVIANRTPQKAREIIEIINERDFILIAGRVDSSKPLSTHLSAASYDELLNQQFDLVINATSAGLTDSEISLPSTIFAPGALAYEMMYGRETPFMKFAREQGAAIVSDGLGMLVEQAAESFFIWRGVRPDTTPVLAKLRETA